MAPLSVAPHGQTADRATGQCRVARSVDPSPRAASVVEAARAAGRSAAAKKGDDARESRPRACAGVRSAAPGSVARSLDIHQSSENSRAADDLARAARRAAAPRSELLAARSRT